MEREALGVAALAARITGALRGALPEAVWVRGEVMGVKQGRGGARYFQLVERRAGRTVATLQACVLGRDAARFDADLGAAPALRFDDGLEVLVRGRVSFYEPSGGVQLLVDAIDPAYTLGKAAAARERLLGALAAEGLLRRNAAHAVPAAALRVGLVTAAGSDAAADVLTRLEGSGYAFEVLLADARVQGRDCEASVVDALRALVRAHRRRPLDVVLVTRGGGSRTDLAGFDGERVARAIAACPFPVITAIGHQQDRTVADEVAHTACPTPTAAAAALIERAQRADSQLTETWARIGAAVTGRLDRESGRLDAAAQRIWGLAGAVLARADAQLTSAAARIAPAASAAGVAADRDLTGLEERLAVGTVQLLDREAARLHAFEAQLRALDPAEVLARGYSITRDQTGVVIRSPAQLQAGDLVVTTLADGEFAAVALPSPAGPPPPRPLTRGRRRGRRGVLVPDSQLGLFDKEPRP